MAQIAIISPDATADIINNIKKLRIEPIPIPRTVLVEERVSGHPDMQLFIYDNKIYCHPGISKSFIKKIEKYIEVILCSTPLTSDYPHDIAYNIACTGKAAFHHTTYTDQTILNFLKSQDIRLIHVKQGYAKCSTLIIDDNRIITADTSIHNAALLNNIESLLIEPGYVSLLGYNYGFIGGASGLLENKILLTGTIAHHPSYKKIMEFIEESGKEIVELSKEKIIDLGSIFVV